MALCETYKGNWISVQMSDSLLSPQFSNDDGWHTFQKDGSYQLVCARAMNYCAESVENYQRLGPFIWSQKSHQNSKKNF